jgi:hypothetical protein
MPRHEYHNEAGERIPGVTSVLAYFGEGTEGLVHWAYQVGRDGRSLDEARGAVAGSLAHALIEAEVMGHPAPDLSQHTPEIVAKAQGGFAGWQAWKAQSGIELIAAEFPLTGPDFGGTLDAVGLMGGKPCLLDWKSSKRLYRKSVAQTSAYAWLWDLHHPDMLIESIHILRLGPDGEFAHHLVPPEWRSAGWRIFCAALDMYRAAKLIRV